MGLVYLAALVVGLGVLLLQVFFGGHDHVGGDLHGSPDHAQGDGAESGFVAFFASTRFWIFGALGFGLSGSLLHVLDLASPLVVLALALAMGVGSGLFAVLAFRAASRSSAGSTTLTSDAAGRVGRVLVACSRGGTGQIRVELRGQSVDLLATTDEDEIARGESVLVEEVRGTVAHVSRRPAILA